MTWTSDLYPLGNKGRIGRSVSRAANVAASVGRPSRLMKPPGIFPAAYMRSSYSTVSGKKPTEAFGSRSPTTVVSTVESPYRTTTAPSACWATRPVSNERLRPARSISTRVTAGRLLLGIMCSFHSACRIVRFQRRLPDKDAVCRGEELESGHRTLSRLQYPTRTRTPCRPAYFELVVGLTPFIG